MEKVYCSCGCGKKMPYFTKQGLIRKYIHGHNGTGKHIVFKNPEQRRINCSLAHLGKVLPEETRKKIKSATTKQWKLKAHRERRRSTYLKNNPIDINYFRKLSCRNAYVFGYLLADGYLRKLPSKYEDRYGLSFSSIDKELIEKIRNEFSIERRRIRLIVRKGKDSKGNDCKKIFCISIVNGKFIKNLINFGMVPGKKYDRIIIPKLISDNKLFFGSFLRGYFDGDGYICSIMLRKCLAVTITSASIKFLVKLKKTLFNFGITSRDPKKNNNSAAFNLNIYGKLNIYKLYILMYKNSNNLFLTRKKKRFEDFFKSYNWLILNKEGKLLKIEK